ncbi:MAG: intradiol ring-cleavage dioxygenase [Ideonella sp.]|jgi:protocatechuate 3,4-dioxygenase beta subunit|nr:intradiol ring-cleavage dioxygenase [Ideonella sp.]
MTTALPCRRTLLTLFAGAGAGLLVGSPVLAQPRRALVEVSEGPFYPAASWRTRFGTDWDFDLTRVARTRTPSGEPPRDEPAMGEPLGLDGVVVDTQGRPVDGCDVEIWQCDARAAYHHPRVSLEPGRWDPGFAGFGMLRTAADGRYRFRTIRPVPYPGRTPHIHLKLRHPNFGELTTQLFVDGDPGNAGDFLWRRIAERDRPGVAMVLDRAPTGSGLAWTSRHALVVPA